MVPPPRCPTCNRFWPFAGEARPREKHMECSCTRGGHTLWICPACGTWAAEDCTDVGRWSTATTPAGLAPELRATVSHAD